jgi:dTDP-4-dehydrorhamnose reductase
VLGQPGLAGYVVRTAWLYGAHGRNFVSTMIAKARGGTDVRVVDDQYGQPTWTMDVALQIAALVEAGGPPGVYHATSSGQTTWFGLAEVFRAGADPAGQTDQSCAGPARAAARPRCSAMPWVGRADPIGDWRTALHRAFRPGRRPAVTPAP